ncbi:MAG: 3-dehydroquinate synthase [Betaproteobacteria bacterium]|nr:3-dehydroquinate synthase [Betaproteobacteria bacterium]
MRTLRVNLAERGYPIHIGHRILQKPDLFAPYLAGQSVAIVTNETVAPLYLSTLCDTLTKLGIRPLEIILPDGEKHKNWQTLQGIFDALLAARYERNSTLIALGGGVIGDMGGFAAACYQRGMPFIQIPTTLLAQVDSSVGGKTAINHPLGKNMIGAFYQPRLVLADTHTLATLPDRELSAGFAEVIKYGLIRDRHFLDWLEEHLPDLRQRHETLLEEAIWQSCRHKAEIVAADEREAGERALLNLGHTFGHAIETGVGYGSWLHGEAVAAGTVMAAQLSCMLGFLPEYDVLRVKKLFAAADLPVRGPGEERNMRVERYLSLMRHDKKTLSGKLRLILLKSLGEAFIHAAPDEETVMEAIRICSELE